MAKDTNPLSAQDVVRSGLCIGCGSCAAQARGADARMALDRYGELKPAGAAWLRSRSASLARTCPFSPAAVDETQLAAALFPDAARGSALVGRFEAAYVGHVTEAGFREAGSSGGMVSWTASELLRTGRVDGVAHVAANEEAGGDRLFGYRLSRSPEEVRAGAKSRYYPVEMSEVIRTIRATPGRYAVVGVPCFIKAMQLLRREDPVMRERVAFSLGLFCGHMKSTRLVESFAWQMGIAMDDIARVDYRSKNPGRPANWYTVRFELRDGRTLQKDWFHLAEGDWGAGFFQNAACNFCDDVVAETADIAFGDAWVEPYSSDGRGTNVVLVRSPVLARMLADGIREGRLQLEAVDEDFVERTQAAGLRQRREGLAYRLTWHRRGMRPRKRVLPAAAALPWRRKLIYRLRAAISAWSRRLFRLARIAGVERWYVQWARRAGAIYHVLAYSQGRLARWFGLGA
ncbi:Coenzyme F420 hydrogenase/dehydrogenase, beta subunit C-terminal domain [Variovorax paradoxus]|nr:Coenzyme F420 hydrogenase/dehydrogenase, beta subunit C-terminal domain [Variovorax paradoxus]